MDKMRERVHELTSGAARRSEQNIVQIRFNAWHYSDASLWASLAVGGEGDLILPLSGWVVGLRIEPEFSARNRTEGWMSLLTIAYSLQ